MPGIPGPRGNDARDEMRRREHRHSSERERQRCPTCREPVIEWRDGIRYVDGYIDR